MSHRDRASPDSRLFASRMRFPVGTTGKPISWAYYVKVIIPGQMVTIRDPNSGYVRLRTRKLIIAPIPT
jgi:hypothetical protein